MIITIITIKIIIEIPILKIILVIMKQKELLQLFRVLNSYHFKSRRLVQIIGAAEIYFKMTRTSLALVSLP